MEKNNDILLEDDISQLQIDKKYKVNPQVLKLISNLFNDSSSSGSSGVSKNLFTELKPYLIIAILYVLFNLHYLDNCIDKFIVLSTYPKLGLKTLSFIIILYILFNYK
jgi:hypothetical protein